MSNEKDVPINQPATSLPPATAVRPDLDRLIAWLRERLHTERLEHSVGAQKKALELAWAFGFPEEIQHKALLGGLLHDCAKLMSPSALIDYCYAQRIEISPLDKQSPQTLHPFVGAHIVMSELGIIDQDVLNAIRYHTTGRPKMSDVEKIVYIADKIEENTRNPLYTQKIKELFDFRNRLTLDVAVLYLMDSTITFLIEKGQLIHPRTIDARNALLDELKSKQTPYHYSHTLR